MSRRDALVLVADDDNSSSSAIEKMLAKDGHRCLRARNGQEALRLFWDERPDLIILDVMMPLLDGFQVCERIREHDRATPVLFLTAKGDIVDKRIGYGIGGDDYLVKPFSGEELRLPGGGSLASRANCGRSRSVRAPKRAIPRRRPGSERAHGECAPGGKTSRAYSQGVEDHGGAGIASGGGIQQARSYRGDLGRGVSGLVYRHFRVHTTHSSQVGAGSERAALRADGMALRLPAGR